MWKNSFDDVAEIKDLMFMSYLLPEYYESLLKLNLDNDLRTIQDHL